MEPLALIPKSTKRKIAMQFSIRQKPDRFLRKLPIAPRQAVQVTSKTYPYFVSFAFFVVIKSGVICEIIAESEFCCTTLSYYF